MGLLRILLAAFLGCLASLAVGRQYLNSEGGAVSQGVVIESNDQAIGPANPLPAMSMPFRRLHSAPIRLKALGTVPKSFPITRPPLATTYRIVNPCDVDIRVLGTMSADAMVSADTGVLYLARTEATMGTSKPDFISAITIGPPTGDCTPEMHYGVGGG